MSFIECCFCKIKKPRSEFVFKNKSKGKLHGRCKDCRSWKTPPEYYKNKKKESLERFYKYIHDSEGCSSCGNDNPNCLDAYGQQGEKIYYYKIHSENHLNLIKYIKCANCMREEKRRKNG